MEKERQHKWLLICLMGLNVCTSYSTTITLDVAAMKIINVVDKRFLSFTIDSHQLAKGWKDVDLGNNQTVSLSKHLYPAYLRVGGTDSDIIEFAPQFHGKMEGYNDRQNTTVLVPSKDVLTLMNFVNETQFDLVYGLNALLRTKDDEWDLTNTECLLNFFSLHNFKIYGLELGNEPDSFYHVFNKSLISSKLAHDFGLLKTLISQYPIYNDTCIIGPDVTRPTGKRSRALRYLKGFLKNVGTKNVDKITFHQYYFSGRNATVEDFTNTTIMDVLQTEIRRASSAVNKYLPGKAIWIGETASCWGGGCPNISDRFASSFMWIDKLGQAARFGVHAVLKQSLIGGHYGLLSSEGNPTPDYFTSVLYKRLVGPTALDVYSSEGNATSQIGFIPNLRLYAHCTVSTVAKNMLPVREGSVTIFGINVGNTDLIFRFPIKEGLLIYEYLLQAPDMTSSYSYLNGVKLTLDGDGNLPRMDPITRRSDFIFTKLSIGFWVLPFANNTNCFTT